MQYFDPMTLKILYVVCALFFLCVGGHFITRVIEGPSGRFVSIFRRLFLKKIFPEDLPTGDYRRLGGKRQQTLVGDQVYDWKYAVVGAKSWTVIAQKQLPAHFAVRHGQLISD